MLIYVGQSDAFFALNINSFTNLFVEEVYLTITKVQKIFGKLKSSTIKEAPGKGS